MKNFTTNAGTAIALAGLIALAGCGHSSGVLGIGNGGSGSSGGSSGGSGSGTGGSGANNLFMSILPPGENGNSAGGVGVQSQVPAIQYPANFRDQLDMYQNLAFAKSPLIASPAQCTPPASIAVQQASSNLACNYFKHEGLTPDTVVSSVTLAAPNGKNVTIQRDGWDVPFVTGDDRASAMYGVGYAEAQDRLWLYDLLRNVGRGQVSQFLGPSPMTYSLDQQYGTQMGYSDDELNAMAASAQKKFGTLGDLAIQDVNELVQGMNAYIAFLQTPQGLSQVPPEYATLALGVPPKFPPRNFTVADIVINAALIQAIFGGGGGSEGDNVNLLQVIDPGFGPNSTSVPEPACEFWRDLRHANDPESPATTELSFATQSPPTLSETCPHTLAPGAAIWDPGSYQSRTFLTHVPLVPVPAAAAAAKFDKRTRLAAMTPNPRMVKVAQAVPAHGKTRPGASTGKSVAAKKTIGDVRAALLALIERQRDHRTISNFIGVTANQTQDGHPIAVMGPQTSYYVPQLLSEMSVVSKGGTPLDFATRGIMTLNLPYVVIGRGSHYAWSATSGESDLIDTRVSYMCNMDGSPPSRDPGADGFPKADGYMFDMMDGNGPQCRRFYKRTDTWTATTTPASVALGGPAVPDTVTRYILRTHYGLVYATATVGGKPVAISQQRSTFYGELDTVPPFTLVGTHIPMNHTRFKQLFNSMTSTFNWLYLDENDLGYYHSGLYPKRAAGVEAELPAWGDGRYEWQSDANYFKAHPDFFTTYGGSVPFPSRSIPVAQGDPMNGYFEWPDYMSLADHPQETNPPKGYFASWNNRPARDWWAADGNGSYGPIHRVDMLRKRIIAFQQSGKKFDIGNMIEVMSDAAFTDLRAMEVLPLLLQLMQTGTTALSPDHQAVVTLMQNWLDQTSSASWIGPSAHDLGGMRRDRSDTRDSNGNLIYDNRAQVVLMDAWYPHLINTMLPQMTAAIAKGAPMLQSGYDAPRAQGSAFQDGFFEQMYRLLETALNVPGHTDYRYLTCAGSTHTGSVATEDCRQAVLHALDQALNDLGGLSNKAAWDGTQLVSAQYGAAGHTVEDYDAIRHNDFSLLAVPAIHWENRHTFQQAVQVFGPEND
ncbi:MAG: penicillin acylase family protein [Stenotrophobium sp.]